MILRTFTLMALSFFSLFIPLNAKEITLKYKNLTLNAELELAEGKTFKDGVILITHGSLAHRDMQTLTYLRELLAELEYSTLAINLSLGLDNRHGMYDCKTPHHHIYDDALDEIDQWIAWLKSEGTTAITLLGHSKGGAQTALYALERDSKIIKSIILMAPSTKSKGGTKKLYNQIQRAKLIKSLGNSETKLQGMPIMHCKKSTATVKSFLSYNAFSPRHDTPTLLPELKKPTLVLVGGQDNVVRGLEKKVAPLVDNKKVFMKVVETAGHFFRDLNMDEAVEYIEAFLEKHPL